MAATNKTCPACGMPQSEWPNPAGVDGIHCCEGCANGTGCTCTTEVAGTDKPAERTM